MGVYEIVLIICICLFIFSFCFLFHNKIATFFKKIGGKIANFFKKIGSKIASFFSKFKKSKNNNKDLAKKDRATKSLMQTRPVLRLPEPEKNAEKKVKEIEEVLDNKDNLSDAQKTFIKGGKFTFSNDKFESNKVIDERKNRTLRSLDEISKDYIDFDSLEREIEEDDDYEDIDETDKKMYERLKENSTINIDGEDIDLMCLPSNIRRLLLSGILDRKNFDN